MLQKEALAMPVQLPQRVADNIDRFTGRVWLLPRLLEWWEHTDERLFLLIGGPGTGKSMILAWLAGHGPSPSDFPAQDELARLRSLVKAVHFCQANSRNNSPRAFAESIANQLTETVKGFADALVATLAERVSIVGTAQAGTAATGSNLTGVSIGRIDLGALGDELSFDRAFTDPLNRLYAGSHKEPMLLLIDALDEAQTYTGVTLPDILHSLTDLPINVRILATTRDDPDVLKFFQGIKRLDLVLNAPPDVDDVRTYTEQRLTHFTAVAAAKREVFAPRLAKQADGVFLYAAMILDELLVRPLSDLPDLDTYPLPKDLSGIYHDFLLRELGEDLQRWLEFYEPLLGLIAVAQGEGLSTSQLENIIGKDIRPALFASKQYLSGEFPEGPFTPFHRSFAEFLLEDKDNVYYHIDSASMHQRIAHYYWSKYRDDWLKCDDYGLAHLAIHLTASQNAKQALDLLEENWMRARYKRGGHTYEGFAADVQLVRARLRSRGLLAIEEHTKLGTMYHLVLDRAATFQDRDLSTLVLLGRETEALSHVRMRALAGDRCRGLLQIYQTARAAGDTNIKLLDEAAELARRIEDSRSRAKAFMQIAESCPASSNILQECALSEALDAISSIDSVQHRWYSLTDVIDCMNGIGLHAHAVALLADLRSSVLAISQDLVGKSLGGLSVLAEVTTRLVRSLAESGQTESATELTYSLRLHDLAAFVSCLSLLSIHASTHAKAKALLQAEEAYRTALDYPYQRTTTLADASVALKIAGSDRAGDALDLAIDEARRSPESPDRARGLSRLAHVYYAAEPTQARLIFSEAIELATEAQSAWALSTIASDLVDVAEYQSAIDVASLIASPEERVRSLIQLGFAFHAKHANASEPIAKALQAFDEVRDEHVRQTIGRSLASALATTKDPRAAAFFEAVIEFSATTEPDGFDWAIAKWVPVFAQAGRIHEAVSLTRFLEKGSSSRFEAIASAIDKIDAQNIGWIKQMVGELEPTPRSANMLISLADHLLAANHDSGHEVLAFALTVARGLDKSCDKADALSAAAWLVYHADSVETNSLFDEAYEAALNREARDPIHSHESIIATALRFALCGRRELSHAIMKSIEADGPNSHDLRIVASSLAQAGEFDEALNYADCIRSKAADVEQLSWTLSDISLALNAAGQTERALKVSEEIVTDHAKIRTLSELAVSLSSRERERASALFARAIALARGIRDNYSALSDQASVFAYLLRDLCRGAYDEAQVFTEEAVSAIRQHSNNSDKLLHTITLQLSNIGSFGSARRLAEEIYAPDWHEHALVQIGLAQAAAGQFKEAESDLASIRSVEARDSLLYGLALCRAEADNLNSAESLSEDVETLAIAALLFAELARSAGRKGGDKVDKFIDKARIAIRGVDDKKVITEVARRVANAGRPMVALELLSQVKLNAYLSILGEWSGLLASPATSTDILEKAAGVAGWTRADWREVFVILSSRGDS
jgi:tetratricopeptide (TPR) repeat protein